MVVSMLAEDCIIRAIERITGIHRDTIMRLGVRVGEACAKIARRKNARLDLRSILEVR